MNTANPIDMFVGGRIRLRRIQAGKELGDLASTLGISTNRLQTVEAGRERVGAALLVDIANALGAAPQVFLRGPEHQSHGGNGADLRNLTQGSSLSLGSFATRDDFRARALRKARQFVHISS